MADEHPRFAPEILIERMGMADLNGTLSYRHQSL